MKRNILISLLTLAALLTACTDDPFETPSSANGDPVVPEGYYFVLDGVLHQGSAQTRVAYTDINHSYFEEDDRVGIYAIDADGNHVSTTPPNAPYRVTNVTNISTGVTRQVLENINPDREMPRGYSYVIYYPYDPDMTFNQLRGNLTHTVSANQHTNPASAGNDLTAYEQSDLLWDVAEDQTASDGTTHYVNIRMDHAMANIILNVSEDYLSGSSAEEGYKVYITNSRNQARGINLTRSLDYTDSNGNPWSYNSEISSGTTATPIKMWCSGYASSGELQFRAAIPACQTILAENAFLQIPTQDGNKQFKLKENLALRPGKNYIFNIRETTAPDEPIIPEVTDDDSWVLDVLDPETGEPVGLLCREYLHYQPQQTTTTEQDKITGTEVTINGETKKCISSQAWVFYKLQSNSTIPDLNTGTVLCFIYDIHINDNNNGDAAHFWPLPHYQSIGQVHQGLFTPEHGFKWIMNPTPISDNYYYGISSSEVPASALQQDQQEQQYYMHGGVISWDGNYNYITDFTSTQEITNSQAKENGHIAIKSDGTAEVSYTPLDNETEKVGIIVPHYLIDQRINGDGELETNRYPLVKIGYNQFWMSQPLRATSLTDGTPITCYNQKGTEDNPKPAQVTFTSGSNVGRGYIYPFKNDFEGTTKTYDPYNDPTEMAGGIVVDGRVSSFRPSPLYNKTAVEDDKFVPISYNSDFYYVMPTADDMQQMTNYFGYLFAAKMCTREIAQTTGAGGDAFAYDKYTAITRGETQQQGTNYYTANISGFNLRAIGNLLGNQTSYTGLGEDAALILKSDDPSSVAYINFHAYDPWSTSNMITENGYKYGSFYTNYFAQVRILMKYRNQADTGGSTAFTISSITRSSSSDDTEEKSINHNIYVPIQPAD